jgi:uncharacterized protein YozE (UPF0346 family)
MFTHFNVNRKVNANETRKDRRYDQLGQFDEFDSDFTRAKTTLPHIYLNVYLNAQGTVFANDSNGNPIENKLVYFISYTLPYNDPVSNEPMPGFLKLVFQDHSFIKSFNNAETTYWYSITGLTPFEIKQFT